MTDSSNFVSDEQGAQILADAPMTEVPQFVEASKHAAPPDLEFTIDGLKEEAATLIAMDVFSRTPIFQVRGQTQVDKNHHLFDSVDKFIRRFEKTMDLHQVNKDCSWKLYLTYAMAGDDVDLWFNKHLRPPKCNLEPCKEDSHG
ncbi:unnamed protein product [Absidia cylindrospora]